MTGITIFALVWTIWYYSINSISIIHACLKCGETYKSSTGVGPAILSISFNLIPLIVMSFAFPPIGTFGLVARWIMWITNVGTFFYKIYLINHQTESKHSPWGQMIVFGVISWLYFYAGFIINPFKLI
jgi:hypothetical protein